MSQLDDGKWITGLSRRDRTSTLARATLRRRLTAVEQRLPLAANRAGDNIEHVHQLRVATRRAVVAVRLYRELLPRRTAKRLLKELKVIRQASGRARDLDVLLSELAAVAESDNGTTLVQQLRQSRSRAQEPISELHRRLIGTGELTKLIDETVALVEKQASRSQRKDPRFGKWARKRLRRSVKRFFKAEPQDWHNLAALHRFRIRGKELRYTMELLAGAFPQELRRQLYPQVEQVQERLGEINDHCAAIARFERWRDEAAQAEKRARFEELLEIRRGCLERSRQKFVDSWQEGSKKKLCRSFRKMLRR
ncbi:MAG: CHAD domain-containing protein [Pirellulales bacterium]